MKHNGFAVTVDGSERVLSNDMSQSGVSRTPRIDRKRPLLEHITSVGHHRSVFDPYVCGTRRHLDIREIWEDIESWAAGIADSRQAGPSEVTG